MSLRPIAAIPLPDLVPGMDPVSEPIFEQVDPNLLMIEEEYQRDLTSRSVDLIRRIVTNWSWRKFKTPTCAMTEQGLVVLDGQHTAIAAACHPDIVSIPIMIIDALDVTTRAASFIGINRDRLTVSPTQLHAAGLIAGEEEAVAVDRVATAAGIVVLKSPPSDGKLKPRETIAIGSIRTMVKRIGEDESIRVLKILADADLAPLSGNAIKAVEALLTESEFERCDPDHLAETIKSIGASAEREAKIFATTHSTSIWRGLVDVWFRKSRKKRGIGGASEAIATPKPTPRIAAVPAPKPPVVEGGPKRDSRPTRGAWSPGPFARRCLDCEETFVGAKNAMSCADCAYGDEARIAS